MLIRASATRLRWSLRVRLTALSAVAAAIVLTISALLLYSALSSALSDAVSAELRIRAGDVAAELAAGSPPIAGAGLLTQVLTTDGEVVSPQGATPVLAADELAGIDREHIVDTAVAGIGDDARVLTTPARAADGRELIVAVAGSTAPIAQAERALLVVLCVAGPLMVLAVSTLAWLVTGAALRPVRHMTRRAATISLRDPSARLPQPAGDDEIAELGATLNRMLDRIAATVAHERAFVDDASHELRTPLAVLRGELELARFDVGDDSARAGEALDSALEETDRLTALTQHLLFLARADAGRLVEHLEPVALRTAVCDVVQRIGGTEPQVDVVGEDVAVMADPVAVDQLVTNLLTNARRWARRHVRVEVREEPGEPSGARHDEPLGLERRPRATLVVADDGAGFDPAVIDRVFGRFSRGDTARSRAEGTGLGLAIVAAVASALGGRAAASNGPPLGGACVRVTLPLATRHSGEQAGVRGRADEQ